MWNGISRRRFPRVNAPLLINIYHHGHERAITTKTESIGQGGVSTAINEELDLASVIHVKLILPKISKMVECDGKVVWIIEKHISENGGIKIKFDTGIEFINMTRDDRSLIEKLVGEYDWL